MSTLLGRLSAACLAGLLLGCGTAGEPARADWRTLQPGLEYAAFTTTPPRSRDSCTLHVLRIDASRAHLRALLASEHGRHARTAGDWCYAHHLAAAINLGMYAQDHLTNVGYLRAGDHVNNGRWNVYKAALGVNPRVPGRPPIAWVDLDTAAYKARLGEYAIAVQNLRLIRTPATNVWKPTNERRWSESAVAVDSLGRLLFVFCRAPLSGWEFGETMLHLPLGVTGAMHVEGGAEASLSIHAGGVDVDLSGSYDADVSDTEGNPRQWPIPNVLGVERAR